MVLRGSSDVHSQRITTHLLLRAGLWPELEQSLDDLLRQSGVFLQELHDAVRQLRVVQRQAPHLVQRDQNLKEGEEEK